MFKDPIHWFPSLAFSNLLAILVLGSYLVDYIVPKAISSRTIGQVTSNRIRDLSSLSRQLGYSL